MDREDCYYPLSCWRMKTDRITGFHIHQGLCHGRNRTDSPLARFGFIGAYNLIGLLLPVRIPDANECAKTDFPRIGGRFGDQDRIQNLLYSVNRRFDTAHL